MMYCIRIFDKSRHVSFASRAWSGSITDNEAIIRNRHVTYNRHHITLVEKKLRHLSCVTCFTTCLTSTSTTTTTTTWLSSSSFCLPLLPRLPTGISMRYVVINPPHRRAPRQVIYLRIEQWPHSCPPTPPPPRAGYSSWNNAPRGILLSNGFHGAQAFLHLPHFRTTRWRLLPAIHLQYST